VTLSHNLAVSTPDALSENFALALIAAADGRVKRLNFCVITPDNVITGRADKRHDYTDAGGTSPWRGEVDCAWSEQSRATQGAVAERVPPSTRDNGKGIIGGCAALIPLRCWLANKLMRIAWALLVHGRSHERCPTGKTGAGTLRNW
jgi:hypothetical protein